MPLRILVIGLVISVWNAEFMLAKADEPDLIHKLTSADDSVRIAASEQFSPQTIFSLDPHLALRAVTLGIQDANETVRERALGGLQVLVALSSGAESNAAIRPFARAIDESSHLKPLLQQIVMHDSDVDIAISASAALIMLSPRDEASHRMLLDRVESEPFARERVLLLRNLSVAALKSSEPTRARVASHLNDGANMVRLNAAKMLIASGELKTEWLEPFLTLIEARESFADPKLVDALREFDVEPGAYLPRLIALQARLQEDLARPYMTRTLAIYNEMFYKQALDRAIKDAENKRTRR